MGHIFSLIGHTKMSHFFHNRAKITFIPQSGKGLYKMATTELMGPLPGLRVAEGVKGVGQTHHQFLQFIDGVVISAISAFVSILAQFVCDVQSIVPRYVESSATEST